MLRHHSIATSVNAMKGNSWRATINPHFEQRRSFGVDLQANSREYDRAVREGTLRLAPEPSPEELQALPTEFDSIKQWPFCEKVIGDIRDQSNCG